MVAICVAVSGTEASLSFLPFALFVFVHFWERFGILQPRGGSSWKRRLNGKVCYAVLPFGLSVIFISLLLITEGGFHEVDDQDETENAADEVQQRRILHMCLINHAHRALEPMC